MATRRTYSKPSDAHLRSALTAMQYEVTQHDGTEPPFRNTYWDCHDAGLYVDVTTGEPLFSSIDKFDSGTGWPSFSRPVEPDRVSTKEDVSHGMRRTEARSVIGNAHLGHVFNDGPKPLGTRYCINSASIRFVPAEKLKDEGYPEYVALFGGVDASPTPAASENSCAVALEGDVPGCETTLETAIVAGGCFWGMEKLLLEVPGVLETEVGYTGGQTTSPTYDEICSGTTGHAEAVRVVFDPKRLSYADLLENWFFRMHDPTSANRQGHDVGTQYRSAIFVTSPAQREAAESVKKRLDASRKWGAELVTEIVDAGPFTRGEEYHQKYLLKNPGGYSCHYLRG